MLNSQMTVNEDIQPTNFDVYRMESAVKNHSNSIPDYSKVLYLGNDSGSVAAASKTFGTNPWVVVVDSDVQTKIKDMTNRLEKLEKFVGQVTAVPLIQNVAAQILVFLIQKQPCVPTPFSDYFSQLETRFPESYAIIAELCNSDAIDLKLSFFTTNGDQILNRRNGSIHPANVAELDDFVENAREAFDISPQLIKRCRQEYTIIDKYEKIKAIFPSLTASN